MRNSSELSGSEYRYLRSTQQFLEIGVESEKMLAKLNDYRRQPRIGDIVGGELLLDTELPH